MSEKVNDGQRSKYIRFRFQDSLRKYQQPPTKRIKLNEAGASHVNKVNNEMTLYNRLARLCETRRLYNASSREKASEYSKRKQAMHQSGKKGCDSISDFNCSGRASIQYKENADQFRQGECSRPSPSDSNSCLIESHAINFPISFPQSPIQQKSQQIKQQASSNAKSIRQFEQLYKISKRNQLKVKDIDFHIGLVEELHKKIINQFQKSQIISLQQHQMEYQAQNIFNTRIQQNIMRISIGEQESMQSVQQQKDEDEPQKQIQCIKQDEVGNSIQKIMEKHQNNKIYGKVNENAKKDVSNNYITNETAQIQHQNKYGQKEDCNYRIKQQAQNVVSFNRLNETPQGRIKINKSEKQFSISARVFYKICRKMKSSTEVVEYVIKSHPYLKEVSQYLQGLAKLKKG